MAPAIVLNPTHAKVGTSVLITGSGFAAMSAMTFKFGGGSITASDGPITSDGTGAFTAHITIPASVQGAHTVEADDASTGTATATFTTDPNFTIDPTTGPADELVTLTGTGFAATSAVTVQLDGVTVSPVSPITSNSTGGVSGSLQLSKTIAPGAHTITITDASSNTLSATFTVTQGLQITVTPINPNKGSLLNIGKIDTEGIPVANDSYVTVGLIDVRNYIRSTLEIFCSDSANDLVYSILGLIGNEDGSLPDPASAKWVSVGSSYKDQNVTHQTGAIVEITTRYSWLRVDVKRKTTNLDSTLDIYGRLHPV